MWIFTTDGFISCVRQGDQVAVRAREHATLEAMQTRAPWLGEIIVTPRADYRYRCMTDPPGLTRLVASLALDVGYPNFKDAVRERQGASLYEKALHTVWSAMGRIQPGGPYGGGHGGDHPPVPPGESRE